MNNITFETLPRSVADLHDKIDAVIQALKANRAPETDRLLSLDELINFLPEHPARQTVYGWICNRQVPYEKHGRRLYFRKSHIETWLSNGRQK